MTVVDHNGLADAFEDMRLMSACRAHVMANSSFSWWGAWLDRRPDSPVVAPAVWFGKERMASWNMDDLLPESWVTV